MKLALIIIFFLLIGFLGSKGTGSTGGCHIKPKSKTPRPKVRPAPQSSRYKK